MKLARLIAMNALKRSVLGSAEMANIKVAVTVNFTSQTKLLQISNSKTPSGRADVRR